MDASKERIFTCPAGRKILIRTIHPLIAQVSEEPFTQLPDGTTLGTRAKEVMALPSEQDYFRCTECISEALACHLH